MRPERFVPAAVVLLSAVLLTSPASAWSAAGHMVTGAMVREILAKTDPEALRAVSEALRQHPLYDELLSPAEDREAGLADTALLMRAARWADDVRNEPWDEYSHPQWHYVNFRYQDGRLDPPRGERQDGFLLWALGENLRRLHSDSARVRAVAITWLFHLVGDMHMPLHDIAFVDADRPDGDRGGNLTYVRTSPEARTVSLHWLWDGMLVDSSAVDVADRRARDLLGRYGDEAARIVAADTGSADFHSWAQEGAELAIRVGYAEGTLAAGSSRQGTLLSPDYLERARPVAEIRAVISAHRLARLLSEHF